MKSSLKALSTPVTRAPHRLASWIAKAPVPPPPPLTNTRAPSAAPSVPCRAIAPAWGIVDACANVSSRGLCASAVSGATRELGEAALEREVVTVDLVTGLEPGHAFADVLDPAGDVRAERPARRSAQPADARVQRCPAQTLPVAEVDRRCGHSDQHLPGARRRRRHLLDPQDLGRPVAVVDRRPHLERAALTVCRLTSRRSYARRRPRESNGDGAQTCDRDCEQPKSADFSGGELLHLLSPSSGRSGGAAPGGALVLSTARSGPSERGDAGSGSARGQRRRTLICMVRPTLET